MDNDAEKMIEEELARDLGLEDDDAQQSTAQSTETVGAQPDAQDTVVATGGSDSVQGDQQTDASVTHTQQTAQQANAGNTAPQTAQEQYITPHAATTGWPEDQQLFVRPNGDIVNRQGEVIAANGKERRMFEQNLQSNNHVQSLMTTIEKLQTELAAPGRSSLDQFMSQNQIQQEDAQTALQFMARYRRDPLSTIRDMVAQTVAQGYTLEAIIGQDGYEGQGVGGIQTSAIQAAVQDALRSAGVGQNEQQGGAADPAQTALLQFTNTYPRDVQMHEPLIAEIVRRDPNPNRFAAGVNAIRQLQTYALNNGLDYNKPLGPQIQAMRAQQPVSQQQSHQPAQIPNAGGAVPSTTPIAQQQAIAPDDMSYEDIIRAEMAAVGMT